MNDTIIVALIMLIVGILLLIAHNLRGRCLWRRGDDEYHYHTECGRYITRNVGDWGIEDVVCKCGRRVKREVD